MNLKRLTLLILLLLLTLAVLAACSGGTLDETVTAEVTRVVTETTTVEGEAIKVSRMAGEAVEEAVEENASAESVGSEHASGAQPAPPDTGAKVDEARVEVESEAAAEVPRAAEASVGATFSLPAATPAPGVSAIDFETVSVDLSLNQNSRLTAGEVDDNAQWDDYLLYLRNYSGAAVIRVDVSERHQIRITDNQNRPVLGAHIQIETDGQEVATLRTYSNGLAYFYPGAFNVTTATYTVNVTVNGMVETFTIPAGGSQREWSVAHPGAEQTAQTNRLDVLFLIDATGSMADEINQLKENIRVISTQIDALPAQPDVRFGMVTYRDRGDEYVTRVVDFTPDVEQFAQALAGVTAEGGGDYPEDLNEALSQAIHQPEWRVDGTVSLIFLVADAPPHLDYGQQNHYAAELVEAAERGIKIYPIASSGLDSQGEYIFRQLAQYTGGRFIFLTYGADGPGTTGTETDFEVSDYTVSSLDALVVKIVEEELAYLIR